MFFYFQLSATDWVLVSADFRILESNATTIPFLRAIWNLCNLIHSYFMDRFAFLIEGTSYIQLSIYLYLSINLSIYQSIHLSIRIYLSICLGLTLRTRWPAWRTNRRSIRINLYLYIHLSIYLYLSINLTIYPSIYRYLSIYLSRIDLEDQMASVEDLQEVVNFLKAANSEWDLEKV